MMYILCMLSTTHNAEITMKIQIFRHIQVGQCCLFVWRILKYTHTQIYIYIYTVIIKLNRQNAMISWHCIIIWKIFYADDSDAMHSATTINGTQCNDNFEDSDIPSNSGKLVEFI